MTFTHKDVERSHTRAVHRQIVKLIIAGNHNQREIADRFGMSQTSVTKVKKGWLGAAHTADLRALLPPPVNPPLERDVIRAIYAAAWDGISQVEIRARYDVSFSTISAIKRRKKHKQHTDDLERERRGKSK